MEIVTTSDPGVDIRDFPLPRVAEPEPNRRWEVLVSESCDVGKMLTFFQFMLTISFGSSPCLCKADEPVLRWFSGLVVS